MTKDTSIYECLGKISIGFTRIDFLISNIAFDLGIAKSSHHFFGIIGFETKLKRLKKGIEQKLPDGTLKIKFGQWIIELDDFRKKRNSLIHSIILFNAKDHDEVRLFSYRSKDRDLETEIIDIKMSEIEKLSADCARIHNEGFLLRNMIEVKDAAVRNQIRINKSKVGP
jgi:hypothetical protein